MPACPVTILESDSELRLFGPDDAYRYDIDNRPLRQLLINDQRLRDCVGNLWTEISTALTSDAYGPFASLDARLEYIEGAESIVSRTPLNVLSRAELLREQYHWGCLTHSLPAQIKTNDTNAMWANSTLIANIGYWHPFGANENSYESISDFAPSSTGVGSPASDTGHPQPIIPLMNAPYEFIIPGSTYIINGYTVDVRGGVVGGAQTPTVAGWPLSNTVKLTGGLTSGTDRVDAVVLETWLQEIDPGNPVFYKRGDVTTSESPATTTDPTHPLVASTIGYNAAQKWVQVQHRLRVIEAIDWDYWGWFFIRDTSILAQGPNGAPEAGKNFVQFVEGEASSGFYSEQIASTVTGPVDGKVYALPLAIIHRRNSGVWSFTNQNGGGIPVAGSGVPDMWDKNKRSDRPDLRFEDRIYKDEILDLRPMLMDHTDYRSIHDSSLRGVLFGTLSSQLNKVGYPSGGTTEPPSVNAQYRSSNPLWVERISGTPQDGTNPVRDWGITADPVAAPDDSRRVWAAHSVNQQTDFQIEEGTDVEDFPLNGFIAYVSSTRTITLDTTALSGSPSAIIAASPDPVIKWPDGTNVVNGGWSGLGTSTASCVIDATDASNHAGLKVRGHAGITYVAGSGLRYRPRRVWKQRVSTIGGTYDSTPVFGSPGINYGRAQGLNLTPSATQGSVDLYKSAVNHNTGAVYITNGSTVRELDGNLAYVRVNTSPGGTGFYPVSVGVSPANGDVYAADITDNRIVRFDNTLVYLSNLTAGGLLDDPIDVDVDSSGNIYVLNRGDWKVYKIDNADSINATYTLTGPAPVSIQHNKGSLCVSNDGKFLAVTDKKNKVVILKTSDLSNISPSQVIGGTLPGSTGPDSFDLSKMGDIRSMDFNNDDDLIILTSSSDSYKPSESRLIKVSLFHDGTGNSVGYAYISGKCGTPDQYSGRGDYSSVGGYLSDFASIACYGSSDYRMIYVDGDSNGACSVVMWHESMMSVSNSGRRLECLRAPSSTDHVEIYYHGTGYHGVLNSIHALKNGAGRVTYEEAIPIYRPDNVYLSTSGTGIPQWDELSDNSNFALASERPFDRDFIGSLPLYSFDWEWLVDEKSLDVYSTGQIQRTDLMALRNVSGMWIPPSYNASLLSLYHLSQPSATKYGMISRGVVSAGIPGIFDSSNSPWETLPLPSSAERYLISTMLVYHAGLGVLLAVVNSKPTGTTNSQDRSLTSNTKSYDLYVPQHFIRLPKKFGNSFYYNRRQLMAGNKPINHTQY